MNRQHIVQPISTSFPTMWNNATKFGVIQVLMAITLASFSGITRICRFAYFSGNGLVKALLKISEMLPYVSSVTWQNPGSKNSSWRFKSN